MSTIHSIIKAHIGNPDEILTAIDDLLYLMVISIVIGEFEAACEIEAEQLAGVKETLPPKAITQAEAELKKLSALIDELKQLRHIDKDILQRPIANRYMVTPGGAAHNSPGSHQE